MADVNEYGDLHRGLLQHVMGYGTIHKAVLKEIFKKLSLKFARNQNIEDDYLKKVIDMINEQIQPFDQKITEHEYGLTNDEFYVFHSTAKTSMSKFQNSYTVDELDFFKIILTKIVENQELSIAPMAALNLCNLITGKINKLRAQQLLDSWIQSHFLYKHVDNKIYLGARDLTEFQQGDHCAKCNTIYHSSCIRKFLTRSDKCPSCKERWEVAADN